MVINIHRAQWNFAYHALSCSL